MSRREKLLEKMRDSPKNIEFDVLCGICEHYFGQSTTGQGSHRVYKTPWPGDPRVNIQRGRDGKAKAYQVKQVLEAIARLSGGATEGDD